MCRLFPKSKYLDEDMFENDWELYLQQVQETVSTNATTFLYLGGCNCSHKRRCELVAAIESGSTNEHYEPWIVYVDFEDPATYYHDLRSSISTTDADYVDLLKRRILVRANNTKSAGEIDSMLRALLMTPFAALCDRNDFSDLRNQVVAGLCTTWTQEEMVKACLQKIEEQLTNMNKALCKTIESIKKATQKHASEKKQPQPHLPKPRSTLYWCVEVPEQERQKILQYSLVASCLQLSLIHI